MTATAWRELLTRLAPGTLELPPGCTRVEITAAESRLGASLPVSLAGCLRATNGFFDTQSKYEYAFALERIVSETLRAWQPPAALPPHLCLIGSTGATDASFAMRLEPSDPRLFVWNWIDGAPERQAADLESHWRCWYADSTGS